MDVADQNLGDFPIVDKAASDSDKSTVRVMHSGDDPNLKATAKKSARSRDLDDEGTSVDDIDSGNEVQLSEREKHRDRRPRSIHGSRDRERERERGRTRERDRERKSRSDRADENLTKSSRDSRHRSISNSNSNSSSSHSSADRDRDRRDRDSRARPDRSSDRDRDREHRNARNGRSRSPEKDIDKIAKDGDLSLDSSRDASSRRRSRDRARENESSPRKKGDKGESNDGTRTDSKHRRSPILRRGGRRSSHDDIDEDPPQSRTENRHRSRTPPPRMRSPPRRQSRSRSRERFAEENFRGRDRNGRPAGHSEYDPRYGNRPGPPIPPDGRPHNGFAFHGPPLHPPHHGRPYWNDPPPPHLHSRNAFPPPPSFSDHPYRGGPRPLPPRGGGAWDAPPPSYGYDRVAEESRRRHIHSKLPDRDENTGERIRRDEGPPGVSLLIRNIAPQLTTDELRSAFARIGEIRDVYIPQDYHSKQPKGFAFIEYADAASAAEAREEMDRFAMHGRELEVVFAQEKRKTPNEMRGRVVNPQNHSRSYEGIQGAGSHVSDRDRDRRDHGRPLPHLMDRNYSDSDKLSGSGRFERSSSFERHLQRERNRHRGGHGSEK
jgi:hypothetical protein